MALIDCYECGKQISNIATACPSCGAPTKREQVEINCATPTKSKELHPLKKLIVIVVGAFFVIPLALLMVDYVTSEKSNYERRVNATIETMTSYFTYAFFDGGRIESLTKASVSEKLSSSLSKMGIAVNVQSVKVTHAEGNKYKGIAAVEVEGSVYKARLNITETDNGVEWKEEAGEFLFLFPYMMQAALSPLLDPAVAKPTAVVEPIHKPETPIDLPSSSRLEDINIPISWSIQLASISSRSGAESLQKTLRMAGYNAYVRNIAGMNRVFVGPMIERAEADRLRDQLTRQQKLNGFVLPFQPR